MKRDGSILERISRVADLQNEPLPAQPLLELCGNCRVLIEHHKGICEYTPTKVRVSVKFGSYCICGTHLEITRLSSDQIVITGNIDMVNVMNGR